MTASPITIQRASEADADVLMEMIVEYYAEESYPLDRPAARRALDGLLAEPERGRVWVVREGGQGVGYLVVTLGWSLEYHGRDAFVDELYVRPHHRRRGIGRRAMKVAEEACRELGVHALHLEVERRNDAARALYVERGFEANDRQLLTKRLPP